MFSKPKTTSGLSIFALLLLSAAAPAAEDWNVEVNYWDWTSHDDVEMCPTDLQLPCYAFSKIPRARSCRNVSGDFENIARGLEHERDQNLTVKFFSCDADAQDIGVLCIDTGQDGGFEACGVVGINIPASLAARQQKQFMLEARPDE